MISVIRIIIRAVVSEDSLAFCLPMEYMNLLGFLAKTSMHSFLSK